MNRKAFFVAAILGGALAAGSAHAGEKLDHGSVSVDQTQRVAAGSLGSVRNTPGRYEYIGCSASLNRVSCYAGTEARVYASCYISSPSAGVQALVASVNGDSYVWFTWDENGVCTDLWVSNNSSFAPK